MISKKQLRRANANPLPRDLSGTYFTRIPERANINMIRAMVRAYTFRGWDCTGLRYDLPSGWASRGNFMYENQSTISRREKAYYTHTIKIRTWRNEDDNDDQCINYTIHTCDRTVMEKRRNGTIVREQMDSHYNARSRIYIRVHISGRVLAYKARDISNCYQDGDNFTYSDFTQLICPRSFSEEYPYDNPVQKCRRVLHGVLYTCKWSRAADGTIQYLDIFDCATRTKYFYATARLAPYVAGGYCWLNSECRGKINICSNSTEFSQHPLRDASPAYGPSGYRAIREFITRGCLELIHND